MERRGNGQYLRLYETVSVAWLEPRKMRLKMRKQASGYLPGRLKWLFGFRLPSLEAQIGSSDANVQRLRKP
jgi:hypothetical protein